MLMGLIKLVNFIIKLDSKETINFYNHNPPKKTKRPHPKKNKKTMLSVTRAK